MSSHWCCNHSPVSSSTPSRVLDLVWRLLLLLWLPSSKAALFFLISLFFFLRAVLIRAIQSCPHVSGYSFPSVSRHRRRRMHSNCHSDSQWSFFSLLTSDFWLSQTVIMTVLQQHQLCSLSRHRAIEASAQHTHTLTLPVANHRSDWLTDFARAESESCRAVVLAAVRKPLCKQASKSGSGGRAGYFLRQAISPGQWANEWVSEWVCVLEWRLPVLQWFPLLFLLLQPLLFLLFLLLFFFLLTQEKCCCCCCCCSQTDCTHRSAVHTAPTTPSHCLPFLQQQLLMLEPDANTDTHTHLLIHSLTPDRHEQPCCCWRTVIGAPDAREREGKEGDDARTLWAS